MGNKPTQHRQPMDLNDDNARECDDFDKTFLDYQLKKRHLVEVLANEYLPPRNDKEDETNSDSDQEADEFEKKYVAYLCKICKHFCDAEENCTTHREKKHPEHKNNKNLFQTMFVSLPKPDVPKQGGNHTDRNQEREKSKDNHESKTPQEYQTLYKCKICEKTFVNKYRCDNHRAKFHPETKRKSLFDRISVPIKKRDSEKSAVNNNNKRSFDDTSKNDALDDENCNNNRKSCFETNDSPTQRPTQNTPKPGNNVFICKLCDYVAKTQYLKNKHRLLEHRNFDKKVLFFSYSRKTSKAKESNRKNNKKDGDVNVNSNTPTIKRQHDNDSVNATPKKIRIDPQTPEQGSQRTSSTRMSNRSTSVSDVSFEESKLYEKRVTTPKSRLKSLGRNELDSKSGKVKSTPTSEIYICTVCKYVAETHGEKDDHILQVHPNLKEETVFQRYFSNIPEDESIRKTNVNNEQPKINSSTLSTKRQLDDKSEIFSSIMVKINHQTRENGSQRSNSVMRKRCTSISDSSPYNSKLKEKMVSISYPYRKSLKYNKLDNSKSEKIYTVYQCKGCNSCFLRKDIINAHLDKCTQIDCKKCDRCSLSFNIDDLEIHVQRDHSEDMSTDLNIRQLSPLTIEHNQDKKNDEDSEKTVDKSGDKQSQKNNKNRLAQPRVVLYKCSKCECCFIDSQALNKHLKRNNHKQFLHKCSICKYKFSRNTLHRHESKHHKFHKAQGQKSENFVIITEEFRSNTKENTETDISNSLITNCDKTNNKSNVPLKESTEINTEIKKDHILDLDSDSSNDKSISEKAESDQEDWTPRMKDLELPPAMKTSTNFKPGIKIKIRRVVCKLCSKRFFLKYPQKRLLCHDCTLKAKVPMKPAGLLSRDAETTIYQCQICCLNFIKLGPIKTHIRIEAHSHGAEDIIECIKPGCGLKFSSSSYTYHRKIHHEKLNLKMTDYNFIVLPKDNNPLLRTFFRATPGARTYRSNGRSSNFVIDELYREKRRRLYKCLKCEKHIIFRKSFMAHMNRGVHNSSFKAYCKTCGLPFSNKVLNLHHKIHHENLNFSGPNDFIIFDSLNEVLRGVKKNSVNSKPNIMVQIHNANDWSTKNKSVCKRNSCNNNEQHEQNILSWNNKVSENNDILKVGTKLNDDHHDKFDEQVNSKNHNSKTFSLNTDMLHCNNNNDILKETSEPCNYVGNLGRQYNSQSRNSYQTDIVEEFDAFEEQSDTSQDEEKKRNEITVIAEVHNDNHAETNSETETDFEENINHYNAQNWPINFTIQEDKRKSESQESQKTNCNKPNFLIEDEETKKLFPNSWKQNSSTLVPEEQESLIDVMEDDQYIDPSTNLSLNHKNKKRHVADIAEVGITTPTSQQITLRRSEIQNMVSKLRFEDTESGSNDSVISSITDEQPAGDITCETSDNMSQTESSESTEHQSISTDSLMNIDTFTFDIVDPGIEVIANSQFSNSNNSKIKNNQKRNASANENIEKNGDTSNDNLISYDRVTSKNLSSFTTLNITSTNIESIVNPKSRDQNETVPQYGNSTNPSTQNIENLHLKSEFENDNTTTNNYSLAATRPEITNNSNEELALNIRKNISNDSKEEDDDVIYVPNPENVIDIFDSDEEVEQCAPIVDTVKKEKSNDIRRYFMSQTEKDSNACKRKSVEEISNDIKKEKNIVVSETITASGITIELSDSDDEITNIVIRR